MKVLLESKGFVIVILQDQQPHKKSNSVISYRKQDFFQSKNDLKGKINITLVLH